MESKYQNWLDEQIDFYDFIWKMGTELCEAHVNQELMADFANGGNKFEIMKQKIFEKFPTRDAALQAFYQLN